ncbi:MAG: PPOX class F420-dependent oxidoreductase [Chloroflexi bacterium]|nr:PPOX class F420-dependent oxidoreductase [Chloroflexota bacterium]
MQGFSSLSGAQYMSLRTFRKSGVAVTTPVWFAETGGKLYFLTANDAGKVKRIRNNQQVTVAPCTASGKVLGGSVSGTARILTESEFASADRLLCAKYGLQKRLLDLYVAIRGKRKATIFLEITPV